MNQGEREEEASFLAEVRMTEQWVTDCFIIMNSWRGKIPADIFLENPSL